MAIPGDERRVCSNRALRAQPDNSEVLSLEPRVDGVRGRGQVGENSTLNLRIVDNWRSLHSDQTKIPIRWEAKTKWDK